MMMIVMIIMMVILVIMVIIMIRMMMTIVIIMMILIIMMMIVIKPRSPKWEAPPDSEKPPSGTWRLACTEPPQRDREGPQPTGSGFRL